MSDDPHDEIAQKFARFAEAARTGDAGTYEALCVNDAPPELELFEENSKKMRDGDLKMRIRRIDQEGQVAEVTFEVVGDGEVVDEAQLTFTEEADGWRIRAL